MSTTTRILVAFLILSAVALDVVLHPLLHRVERQYNEAAEEPMVDIARLMAALLEQSITEKGEIDPAPLRAAFIAAQSRRFNAKIYNLTKRNISTNVYVTDRTGKVLFDSERGHAEGLNYSTRRDVKLTLLGEYGARSSLANLSDPNSSTMYVAAPVLHDGEIAGVVSVSKPEYSMQTFVNETRTQIRLLAGLFFVLVMLGAILVTNVFSRPIRKLTAYAHAVARGERAAAPPLGAPEIVQLGRAFEEMRDALEDREYVQTYVRTLTHEMKSPLSAIRGASELLQDPMPEAQRAKFLANIEAESKRLGTQIDRLLALSAIESRKRLEKRESVPLSDLVSGVCASLRASAEARSLTIAFESKADLVISGESFLIEIAVSNLVQNAIDFSPPGGVIEASVIQEGPDALVVVLDEGQGIPAYALPRLFDRFYSLQHPSTGRKSSGLGLCFVREAAELHDGEATVRNRTDRVGARAVLSLPLTASPGAARSSKVV